MVRYLIKFSKESNIKFISHLDLMRTIQKLIKRAGLPAEYSKGFNPHMNLSIAQPLSVGIYSSGEYMDVMFNEEVNEDEIIDRLNKASNNSIKFYLAKKIIVIPNEKKLPQSMALVDYAQYTIKIPYSDISSLKQELESLETLNEWTMIKKTKTSEKEVNIKSMIKHFKYSVKDNYLMIDTIINCGSRENLSADMLCKFISSHTNNCLNDKFIDIKREELYGKLDKEIIPLYKFASL